MDNINIRNKLNKCLTKKYKKMTKLNSVEVLKTKRFVVRKSLIGKNVIFSFTNKKVMKLLIIMTKFMKL